MITKTKNLNMKLTPKELAKIKELARLYSHGNVTKFLVMSALSQNNEKWWKENQDE